MLYSDSCIPTSHNSFSSSSNGFVFWPQQHLSIKDQLKIGVRGFMLDIYKVKDSVVLRHTSKSIPGVTKPLNGKDLTFYETFKEFVDFIEEKSVKGDCATITILLESYVRNIVTYSAINKDGFADKYLYKNNPNTANIDDVCNKIVLFTSHTRDKATGIHPPSLYKENSYKYYADKLLGYEMINPFDYEKCEERLEGRAKYIDTNVKIFCFNHFTPISALLTLNICIKPLLHQGKEIIDQNLDSLIGFDCKLRLAEQDFSNSMNNLMSLSMHLDQCKSKDIRDKFHPTIIAVDFIEKNSDVFLCYKNEDCSGTKCNLSSEDDEVGFFSKVYNYIFGNNNLTDPHSDL